MNTSTQHKHLTRLAKSIRTIITHKGVSPFLATAICASSTLFAVNVSAQEAQEAQEANTSSTEVIEVQGVRRTIQDAISIKRESTSIVDGLSVEDIGDLPALSIGEAIESITGAASHREQGGATEISIRGLGPYLGSSVINGREATNGSGDRSVNFSQFPSELFNKIQIYKTQEANLIEGGVSGQIQLETVKPLDFGKQRFQLGLKGNWNPDNSDLSDPETDLGSRITASFIDQFYSDKLGEIGISFGVQSNSTTNPEQEARTTSTFRDCRNDPNAATGVFSTGNCDDDGLDLVVDPATGEAPDGDTPFLFVPSQRSLRQNVTDDQRDAVFGAIQWRPTQKLEINLDGQYSDRLFTEERNDLVFAENRRIDSPIVPLSERLPGNLVVTENGSVLSYTNEQRIETNSQYVERDEEYIGGGLEISYDVSERLNISADLSISETDRREIILQTRLQSEPIDINGNPILGADSNGRIETAVDLTAPGSLVPLYTVQNFDVNNHDAFSDAARTRVDLNQSRTHTITAFRTDFAYIPDMEFITGIQGGIRVSELEFENVPRVRDEFTFDDADIAGASLACRNEVFPENGFLSDVTGGNPLITNVDADGNVIAQGTGNSFATFDARCLANTFLGETFSVPAPEDNLSTVDVEEETIAFYLQADYDTFIGDYGVRGNFGLRYVSTDVTSRGFRGTLTANIVDGLLAGIEEDGSELTTVVGGSDYTELLPSLNVIVDVNDNVLVRGAIYRTLSRPDPTDLGFGRSFAGLDDESSGDTLVEAIGLAVANGNPNLEPLTAWNADLAIEWYPNDDTILALSTYIKDFEGGFENASQIETFTVDGLDIDTAVSTVQTTDDTSTIFGAEVTATHAFTYLPSVLSNFGVKLSYNFAESDFEFEDGQFGASTVIDADGNFAERIGIVPPAELFGLSKHVIFGQLYYQDGGFSASLNYKYRDQYFQQFTTTPLNLRFVEDTEVFEARMSYKVNDNIKVSFEAINLFDEPKRQTNPVDDNFAEINVYGPRVFAGVQLRF